MKILRFDSVGGASGDMILGTLIGLGADPRQLNAELARLLPEEKFEIKVDGHASHGISNGIRASVVVGQQSPHQHCHPHDGGHDHDHDHDHDHKHEHEHKHDHDDDHKHEHRTFKSIRKLIEHSSLSESVKTMSIGVFGALAAAEGAIHGMPDEDVHFHEVGAVDSIVDIVGCCLAYHLLGIDGISVSPLPTGSGVFTCQHGQYPLPAPATLAMLKRGNLSSTPTDEPYELLTPTGAALLAMWPKTSIPAAGGSVVASSIGFGQRTLLHRPNLLRAVIYETVVNDTLQPDVLQVLETNIDDCSPEIIAHASEQLFAAGALDVWSLPAQMKKQRCGVILGVLCQESDKQVLLEVIFRETTTFGVREYQVLRHQLARHMEEVATPYGKVRIKVGKKNGKTLSVSPEFEDCVRLAASCQVPLKTIYQTALQSFKCKT